MTTISFSFEFLDTEFDNIRAIFDYNSPFSKCRASRKFKFTAKKDRLRHFKHLLKPYVQFLIDHDMLNETTLSLGADKYLSYIIFKYPASYPNAKVGASDDAGRYFYKPNYNRFCKDGKSKDILHEKKNDRISKYPSRLLAPHDTGMTTLILGSSKSGKTYLLADEINRIRDYEYDLIVLFTESLHVPSLDPIRDRPDIVIKEGFDEKVPEFLKKLNSDLGLRYRFLLILDDIISEKSTRTSILGKMITTYRNSNISTVVLLQDPTFIQRQTRGNFHQIVITGMRSKETNEGLASRFDVAGWAKDRMIAEGKADGRIHKDDIYRYMKELLIENGVVLYIDTLNSLDPIVADLR
jgi:hypothetical protein